MGNNFLAGIKKTIGPGLLMAAAAIGVSHLVQSTRAGATYGFALVWAVLLANIFKYPFLEFGPRYAVATKKTLLEGYQNLGEWALNIFVFFTLGTMFTVQAAVTVVTASLAAELVGVALSPVIWSAIILAICIMLLISGKYSMLDGAIKMIMAILAVSTLVALVAALIAETGISTPVTSVTNGTNSPEIWNVTGIAFLIALMGWMPIPIDAAAWHSIYTLERTKQTKYEPKLRESLFDFYTGYIGAAILALVFLSLGALVMFGSGEEFASSGGAFAKQLIALYTQNLGSWSYPVIIISAFTTMFSTTLTVTDAYPRVVSRILHLKKMDSDSYQANPLRLYRILLVLTSLISLGVLVFLGNHFRLMVDIATTLSFLTAPVLAYMNYRVITADDIPAAFHPPSWLRWLSMAGLFFLTGFALVYVYWQLFV